MVDLAIQTENLVKHYGDVVAVDGLSLRVARGEIYAFLGLNGAGKTTTIRLLLGMIRPTAGEITVLGHPIRHGEVKPWDRVGYLVETADAYPELTVNENLEVFRRLRPGTDRKAVSNVIDQLGLGAYADRRAGTLSHGNAQRLGLAKALLHKPDLLLLDEPANGLDPAGIVEIRNLLTAMAREYGVTVFISSHILGEVARLAQRIGIIHQGGLLRELDAHALQHERRRRLIVSARDNLGAKRVLEEAGYTVHAATDGLIQLVGDSASENPDQVAIQLVQAGYAPTRLAVEQEDLEDYFLRLVGVKGDLES